jgi:hypothetical protein
MPTCVGMTGKAMPLSQHLGRLDYIAVHQTCGIDHVVDKPNDTDDRRPYTACALVDVLAAQSILQAEQTLGLGIYLGERRAELVRDHRHAIGGRGVAITPANDA